jgi:hypothetical protein
MSELGSLRRIYFTKRLLTQRAGDCGLSAVWRSKQEAAPAGTVLPPSFPSYAALTAVGYEASEDLVGTDIYELADYAGLSERDAQAVLDALAKL